jgi:hypothetical protein
MSLFFAHARLRAVARRVSIAASSLIIFVSVAAPLAAQDSTAAPPPAHFVLPIDIHGFIQMYYRGGDPLNKDGFKMRKADIKFSGALSPNLRWRLSFDAAKQLSLATSSTDINDTLALAAAAVDQRSRLLQEAAMSYTVNKEFTVDVGQQLVPLTLEGWIPLANLETIERTNFISEKSRAVGLGYIFDLGATVNGITPEGLEYHAGMFNEMGDSQNATDNNDQKALVGRVDYHFPFLPGFQVGSSGGFEGGPPTQEKQRFGTEAQYRVDALTFRAETMAARDGLLRRFGWYGLSALQVSHDVLLSARYDSWDRDRTAETAVTNGFERQIVLGGNYLIQGTQAKVALNIIYQSFPNISSVRDATFALMAFQTAF